MQPSPSIFFPILLASVLFFCWGMYRRLGLVLLGRPGDGSIDFGAGLREMLRFAVGQKRVTKRPFGINHVIIFWAFIILFAANVQFMIAGVLPGARLEYLPVAVSGPLMALFDIASLAALLAAVAALVRRTVSPPYRGGRNLESYAILLLIVAHMAGFFCVNAAEIAGGLHPAGTWMPVSSWLAAHVASLGSGIATFGLVAWWVHAAALLVFIGILIPYSKHLHIVTAPLNCFIRAEGGAAVPPRESFEGDPVLGAGEAGRFTRSELFDTFACAKCGRCEQVCPAAATGKALNPRTVIENIRRNLKVNAPLLKAGSEPQVPLIGDGSGSIPDDAVWACTTCGACLAACPVLIEKMPKIVQMRRHLVQMESAFPEELLNLFENLENRSNPWGIAPSDRVKWCGSLDVKTFEEGKTEYLLFVGCAGAFDARARQVTAALAETLNAAHVSWGILGKDELCCGDSARRLGNEYLFERMALENVARLRERGVKKIVTACPHCFSTLKNDYRQYGLDVEVIHHAALLEQLFEDGQLFSVDVAEERIAVHDSCYLGRHNGVYEAPRTIVHRTTGAPAAELERNRESSFCCGAGGGRMWMEEYDGSRINHTRIDEALQTKADTICTSCPYCMTMLEDGLKDRQAQEVRVRDVVEVVAERLRKR